MALIVQMYPRDGDLESLRPIFKKLDWHLPDASVSFAIVVQDDETGEIVAFQMVQSMMHVEPHWEHPDYRGKVNWKAMGKEIERLVSNNIFFPGVMCVATTPEAERMAQAFGMKKFPGVVYVKEISKVAAATGRSEEKEG